MQIDDTMAFLTPEEMAAKLRISLRTLHKMMRKGEAPEHIRLGGRVLFVMQGGSHHD